MHDLLYLGALYIRHHKLKIMVLTFAITLVSWLPIAIQSIIGQTSEQLLQRADNTPLVIGAPGSPLELSLASLYFRSQMPATINYGELQKLEATGFAKAIPLYTRFHTQDFAIVGTSQDYFDYRQLDLAKGRGLAMLGEAVIGAEVARSMQLEVGDYILSSPESVFDIAGIYPLKMPIVGILKPAFSPDDEAVFVDIKTTWVIQGLGHGHQDLASKNSQAQVLKKDGNNIVANASVRQYNEITLANIDSFHFHGDHQQRPLSAIIPVAHDAKASALLLGHYLQDRDDVQIVRSQRVIDELLNTVFTLGHYIVAGIAVVAVATATVALLVFFLSLRLRQGESFTLAKIGASQWQIRFLMAVEIFAVVFLSAIFSALLLMATENFGMTLLQQLLLA